MTFLLIGITDIIENIKNVMYKITALYGNIMHQIMQFQIDLPKLQMFNYSINVFLAILILFISYNSLNSVYLHSKFIKITTSKPPSHDSRHRTLYFDVNAQNTKYVTKHYIDLPKPQNVLLTKTGNRN